VTYLSFSVPFRVSSRELRSVLSDHSALLPRNPSQFRFFADFDGARSQKTKPGAYQLQERLCAMQSPQSQGKSPLPHVLLHCEKPRLTFTSATKRSPYVEPALGGVRRAPTRMMAWISSHMPRVRPHPPTSTKTKVSASHRSSQKSGQVPSTIIASDPNPSSTSHQFSRNFGP